MLCTLLVFIGGYAVVSLAIFVSMVAGVDWGGPEK
jgi:hypothetical protein